MATIDTKYTKKNSEIFNGFEPLHYGYSGMPESYLHNNTGIQIQAYTADGFAAKKDVDNLLYNGQKISGVIPGTLPYGHNNFHTTSSSGIKFIYKTDNAIVVKDLGGTPETYSAEAIGLTDTSGKYILPTRIGIAFCGGGGSAGGWVMSDPDKNGSDSDAFFCFGSGGGGGGIVCGILDLSATNENACFAVYTGSGGSAVSNDCTRYRNHNPHTGSDGNVGTNSILCWVLGSDIAAYINKSKRTLLATAKGGGGGYGGTGSRDRGGGFGGKTDITSEGKDSSTYHFKVTYATNGGQGAGANSDSHDTAAMEINLKFVTTETVPDGAIYQIKHPKLEGKWEKYAGYGYKGKNVPLWVTGGHSLGSGANQDAEAGLGGGGACYGKDAGDNRSSSNTHGAGGTGGFMLFY